MPQDKVEGNSPRAISASLERSAEALLAIGATKKNKLPHGFAEQLVATGAQMRVEARQVRTGQIGRDRALALRAARLVRVRVARLQVRS